MSQPYGRHMGKKLLKGDLPTGLICLTEVADWPSNNSVKQEINNEFPSELP